MGAKAIIPRLIQKVAAPSLKILDFGAGTHAKHALALRSQGMEVDAYDFGANFNPDLHIIPAEHAYDLVYASNVLNVQATPEALRLVIQEIFKIVRDEGVVYVNYPASPRYTNVKQDQVEAWLLEECVHIARLHYFEGSKLKGVWMCYKRR